ncbi:MAG: chemotaxis response regulator protein-glutamate methylesterase [Ignavibacteria bacterium]|jgi:two-component system chemotaxis response regulator CheB|nr:chemotaxis response regulator protein-glutamate methylesterase [Ignavibacteria bacterium]
MQPVKLLLVDDSLFMRNSLKKILAIPEIEIVDTAANGKEAVEKNLEYNPDLILLDIEMPVMNGLDALKKIMETNPTAVLMFSTLTQDGAKETVEALSLGALDFIPKQASYFDVSSTRDDLVKKIVALGSNKFLKANLKAKYAKKGRPQEPQAPAPAPGKTQRVMPNYIAQRKRPNPKDIRLVCIGISTGGPVALQEVIPHIPKDLPVPIMIVQHMPPLFTESLAKRLDASSPITVVEAQDGEHLKAGTVYIGKGGFQMTVTKGNTISISKEPANELFKPAVNVMMNSVVDVYHERAVGIIMTGMGNDGQIGMTKLNEAGGYVIAQEPESCVVAGMPRAVIDNKIAHEVQPLHHIAGTIASLFQA